jgi:hypothetical protein
MCAVIPCPMIFPSNTRNALACVSVQMCDTSTRYAHVLQVVDPVTQGDLSGFAWLSTVRIPSQVAVELCLYFSHAETCGLMLSSAEGIQQVCLQDQKDVRRHTSRTLPWHDVTAKSPCQM